MVTIVTRQAFGLLWLNPRYVGLVADHTAGTSGSMLVGGYPQSVPG